MIRVTIPKEQTQRLVNRFLYSYVWTNWCCVIFYAFVLDKIVNGQGSFASQSQYLMELYLHFSVHIDDVRSCGTIEILITFRSILLNDITNGELRREDLQMKYKWHWLVQMPDGSHDRTYIIYNFLKFINSIRNLPNGMNRSTKHGESRLIRIFMSLIFLLGLASCTVEFCSMALKLDGHRMLTET